MNVLPVYSCELLDTFKFFDSLNVPYKLSIDPEGVSYYVSEKDIIIDMIIHDYTYSYYAKIKGEEYFRDNICFSDLQQDKVFKVLSRYYKIIL